jgi:ATP-dependent Lhr-like helicase
VEAFSPAARRWFDARFDAPTRVQREGWPRIASGAHVLLIAPTGSGKTLAAFFSCIDRLGQLPSDAEPGVRLLYVSPLKALVYDIERNLRAPLAGVARAAEELGQSFRVPRVAVRTGDTSPRERRLQSRDPAEILVTTPESLYLILGSRQRATLATVETVIVDEVHALAPSKRGAHLALSLERVAALNRSADPRRVGLSATAQPPEEVARFLGGDRPVEIVDAGEPPRLDVTLEVPVPDMTRPAGPDADEPQAGLWSAIHPRLLEAIRAHRSAIVFVNSRGLCERLAGQLNELAGEPIARAHHGSLAHEKRREIEEALKSGALRAIVATSSLELGIDMGAVDLVMMVESPGSVARGLQRVGRAGHQVGAVSRGLLLPKHRGDLLEATVVSRGMARGDVEPLRIPRNPLDVLAQQIVAWSAAERISVDDLEARVRRAASFRDLSRDQLTGVLDMLSGRYPSTEFAELRPRILWDREKDELEARRGAGPLALVSGGTIPDRGQYAVHLGPAGPRIGELDEEMVHETRAGETLTLGASSWRVAEITRDRVIVTPAPGEIGKLPFWRGEGPGRPVELGRALGAFVRELGERCGSAAEPDATRDEAEAWLQQGFGLDAWAARNLVDYVASQRRATGTLPTDRAITVERFRDELGDWRVCILSPFGARVHAPWALAIEAGLAAETGCELQTLWSDDGVVLRFADADELPDLDAVLLDPDEVEDRVVEQLGHSALFAGQFRENAARALLLPRRRPGVRTPLWTQRLRAQNLLAVARRYPSFPIMLETYRACLQDVFDLPGLIEILRGLHGGDLSADAVETRSASPFARSLVFAWTASFLYQGDAPLAERRAQALTLDRHMLRDLLGQEQLRDLLDASVIASAEAELQSLADERRARHADAVHDLLRRLGDLDEAELAARCDGDPTPWLAELEAARRVARMHVGGAPRWVAAEDAALYRDALGARPPPGLPAALLEPREQPLEQLLLRFARHRGPFLTRDVARRYGLVEGQVQSLLAGLEARELLLAGEFHPHGREREWCDPELLRRLRRRTLARLRGEVAPVAPKVLGRFLPRWHRVGAKGKGDARLGEALEQLEGLPLSFAELERVILPARVPQFDPRMLDERGALGQVVWIGCGALGERDGRIALYRRDRAPLLVEPPAPPGNLSPLQRAILEMLEARGASFFVEIAAAAGSPPMADLLDAMWDLVWRGRLTNDTFAPLRALSARRRPPPGRRRRGRAEQAAAGRWSRVEMLLAPAVSATERAHARALMLLERHGVVSRDALALEALPGGFASVYPVLRAMEEAGKLRRGHFVGGLSGAQFAYAGAVDRLRAVRAEPEEAGLVVLAATDPAQPYGALLPWPETRSAGVRPRRAVGASVVLAGGTPALFLDRGGHRALTFCGADADATVERAAGALRGLFQQRRRRSLRIEEIDGDPALASRFAPAFRAAGFRSEYRSLVLERDEALSGPGGTAGAFKSPAGGPI